MFVAESFQSPTRMQSRQKIENIFVKEWIPDFDRVVHRDPIALGLQKMTGEENSRGNPNAAMQRIPAFRALEREVQLGPRILLRGHFAHRLAVETKLGDREHAVGIDPRIRTADCALDLVTPRVRK